MRRVYIYAKGVARILLREGPRGYLEKKNADILGKKRGHFLRPVRTLEKLAKFLGVF